MQSKITIPIDVNVLIDVRKEDTKEIIDQVRVHNLVVGSGLIQIADLFIFPDLYSDGHTPGYVAIGTDGTTTTSGMVNLGTEVLRGVITRRYRPSSYVRTIYYYLGTTEANGNTLREVGLHTLSSGGNLWARATHSDIVKTSSISISYEWIFTFGAS